MLINGGIVMRIINQILRTITIILCLFSISIHVLVILLYISTNVKDKYFCVSLTFVTFVLYCFYKNKLSKKIYNILILILAPTLIFMPYIYFNYINTNFRYTSFLDIITERDSIVIIWPILFICMSTLFNYFISKKNNKHQ
jgi:TRAP-type uncharacterized transport system fused permease subunit